MRRMSRSLIAASILALGAAMPAAAKTFVYCSEASPEGFDPAPYTAGTTFDASAHAVYNRLAQFKPGTTEVEPALAESWDVADDGKVYMVVKWQGSAGVADGRTILAMQSHEIVADGIHYARDGLDYLVVEEVVEDRGITNQNHEDYGVVPDFAFPDPNEKK